MKKLLAVVAVGAFSLSLIGCGTLDRVGSTGSAVVGSAGTVVGSTGRVVGSAVSTGVGVLVGQRATQQDIKTYRQKGVVYRDGRAYHIRNGKYVAVR